MEGITDCEIKTWQQDLQNGMTINDVAKKYNRAFSVVAKTLRNNRKYRRLTSIEKEEIKKRYKTGESPYSIAENLGFTVTAIYYTLNSTIRNERTKRINQYKMELSKLSEFDIGYLVGLIEGEGCLGIYKEDGRLRPRLAISNVDREMIEYLHNLLPFNMRVHSQRKEWKKIHDVSISHRKILYILLKFLEDKMISKKIEVSLILKFLECKDKQKQFDIAQKLRIEKAKTNSKIKMLIKEM